MGIASLILGILSAIVGFIPFCGSIAFVPAIIGLILGIVDVVLKSKKGEKKGIGIAGIVLSAIAIIIITIWTVVIGAAVKSVDTNSLVNDLDSWATNMQYYLNENY